ncbi:rhomboid-domain-containing protein, partial [Nadsonia fulvescens var. elongata DSM 6958]
MMEAYKGYFTMFPPALTSGLTVFLVAVFLIDISFPQLKLFDSWTLGSQALSSFELNRLSFYPMAHLGWFHLIFNLFALVPLLARYERTHGTVYTGVVLNTVAVFPGLIYAAISWLLFPSNKVAGASGWVFTLLGYFTYKESYRVPAIFISETTSVATWLTPVMTLFVTSVIMPSSSFLGHLLGLLAGWALAMGRIDMMVEPPSNIIIKIESFLDKPIGLIPKHFQFYREI